MTSYVIVANKTLPSDELVAEVRRCHQAGPATFHVVVPASHPAKSLTWTESRDRTEAQQRLEAMLARLRAEGFSVDGEIGDANPLVAVTDALAARPADHVIVSTLPVRVSRWLKQDLPSRIRQTFGITVTHVVAGDVPADSETILA